MSYDLNFRHHGLSRRWRPNVAIVSWENAIDSAHWDSRAVSGANGVNKVAGEALAHKKMKTKKHGYLIMFERNSVVALEL